MHIIGTRLMRIKDPYYIQNIFVVNFSLIIGTLIFISIYEIAREVLANSIIKGLDLELCIVPRILIYDIAPVFVIMNITALSATGIILFKYSNL